MKDERPEAKNYFNDLLDPSNEPTHRAPATEFTACLKNSETLEKTARMTNHASARATRLHDRRAVDITLDQDSRLSLHD